MSADSSPCSQEPVRHPNQDPICLMQDRDINCPVDRLTSTLYAPMRCGCVQSVTQSGYFGGPEACPRLELTELLHDLAEGRCAARLGLVAQVKADWTNSGLTATALGAIGFSCGVLAARVGTGRTPESAKFAGTAEFSVWCGVTGFEVALWTICWASARRVNKEIASRLPRVPTWPFVIVTFALIAAARVSLFLYPTIQTPVYGMRGAPGHPSGCRNPGRATGTLRHLAHPGMGTQ